MNSRMVGSVCLLAILCLGGFGAYGWWNNRHKDEVSEDLAAEPLAEGTHTPQAAPIAEEKLALNLKVGDRFPLLKTVEQQLRQPSPQGWVTSHSKLEMLLHLTVEDIYRGDPAKPEKDPREGQKRLQVKYHRVRFYQELAGRTVQYDSDAPSNPIPLEAQGYHGLKDNSFQFWIGADNQILQMVGFELFLDRCLKDVAPDQKQQVRTLLASSSGADGIANFVDDSIGLLPAEAVRIDETWSRSRHMLHPVPMHIDSKYTLRHITPQVADIDIVGTIIPSANFARTASEQGPQGTATKDVMVVMRGGNCFGSCQIDRRTGLPIFSKVQQSMRMNVMMAGGVNFDQYKTTVTTISAFPEQGGTSPPILIPGVPSAAPPEAVAGPPGPSAAPAATASQPAGAPLRR